MSGPSSKGRASGEGGEPPSLGSCRGGNLDNVDIDRVEIEAELHQLVARLHADSLVLEGHVLDLLDHALIEVSAVVLDEPLEPVQLLVDGRAHHVVGEGQPLRSVRLCIPEVLADDLVVQHAAEDRLGLLHFDGLPVLVPCGLGRLDSGVSSQVESLRRLLVDTPSTLLAIREPLLEIRLPVTDADGHKPDQQHQEDGDHDDPQDRPLHFVHLHSFQRASHHRWVQSL